MQEIEIKAQEAAVRVIKAVQDKRQDTIKPIIEHAMRELYKEAQGNVVRGVDGMVLRPMVEGNNPYAATLGATQLIGLLRGPGVYADTFKKAVEVTPPNGAPS